jgi:hypothetical protein
MKEKIAKFVTGSMLGWITIVTIAIIFAIMLNYAGVVDLSAAYLGF